MKVGESSGEPRLPAERFELRDSAASSHGSDNLSGGGILLVLCAIVGGWQNVTTIANKLYMQIGWPINGRHTLSEPRYNTIAT